MAFWGVVLLPMHTVAGVLLWQTLTAEPEFARVQRKPSWPGICGVACVVVEVVAAIVTAGCVHERVLRAWWYAVPVLMIVTAVLRLASNRRPDTVADCPKLPPG